VLDQGRTIKERLVTADKAMSTCECAGDTSDKLRGALRALVEAFLTAEFPRLNAQQRHIIIAIFSGKQGAKPDLIVGGMSTH
jgi:hypothetical protein